MPKRPTSHRRRIPAAILQPLLTAAARRNARARELAAAMQLPCVACRKPLAAHVGTGNRWKGCR
jgi:hypothetical protein